MVDPEPTGADRVEQRGGRPVDGADVVPAELARPEVGAVLGRGRRDRVGAAAGTVEVAERRAGLPAGPGREVADARGVGLLEVEVAVRGDPPAPALAEQRVPHAADDGRRPVEAAVGQVGLGGVAGERELAGGVLVLAPPRARRRVRGDGTGLGTGGAFHADEHLGIGVLPGPQLAGRVDAEAARVVRQDDHVVDDARALLGAEPGDRVGGVHEPLGGVVGAGARLLPAVQLAVVVELEAAQHTGRGGTGCDEHGGVLGAGDVPLEPLQHEQVGPGSPRGLDLAGGVEHPADVGVALVAVLGEGDGVDPEPLRLIEDRRHGVLRVVRVDRVHVVVEDQPRDGGRIDDGGHRRQRRRLRGVRSPQPLGRRPHGDRRGDGGPEEGPAREARSGRRGLLGAGVEGHGFTFVGRASRP
ncbi:hypothetical protein EDF21_1360 [Frigoribacterium sp. PhB118]|nr:hypothetical protein [Frigoribacterium sp. PhB118]ROS57696.1 hypothetical protein EDF21_1360 [Frigoribacterium sp. PhB118]